MVLTGLGRREAVQRMLVANGVVSEDGLWEAGRGCPAFDSMDAAMVWCEEHFKQARPPAPPPSSRLHKRDVPIAQRSALSTRTSDASAGQ